MAIFLRCCLQHYDLLKENSNLSYFSLFFWIAKNQLGTITMLYVLQNSDQFLRFAFPLDLQLNTGKVFLENELMIYSPSPLGGDIFANILQQQAIAPQQQARGRKIQ